MIDDENVRWRASRGIFAPSAEEVAFHNSIISQLTDEMNEVKASRPYAWEIDQRRYLALE